MSYSNAEAWLRLLSAARSGEIASPRGMPTREVRWAQAQVWNPLTFPLHVQGREFRDVIGVIEGLSLVGEFSVPEIMTHYVKKFKDFEDNGILWGAYGQRAFGSVGNVVELLQRDPDSRQAVITLFDSGKDLNREKRDIPCTISIQFLLRDGHLEMGVSMRSNDVWLGTPYDLMQFSILQASVAQSLHVSPGLYTHRVGSLHIYERDVEKSEGITFAESPEMPFPLWYVPDNRWGSIGHRAREILLGAHPESEFEIWVRSLLDE